MKPIADEERLVLAVGIEDTVIGGCLRGGDELDEYKLTGHRQQWKADLDRVTESRAGAFRYGLPWHEVNPAPGVYDWEAADEVLAYIAEAVPSRLILDLVHYGTPTWLNESFVDEDFPRALADYASQVARRYRGLVAGYTPLNEPLVTASFCGLRGVWPPYLTGDEGWARVVVSVAQAVQRTMVALRQADPDAELVHVDAVQTYSTDDKQLTSQVLEWGRRARLPLRLVLGQVGRGDWEWDWLTKHGVEPGLLSELEARAVRPNVLGLNYYPELSCRELVQIDGQVAHVAIDAGITGLELALGEAYESYSLPLMVAESAVEGDAAKKARWLDSLVAGVVNMRAEGVPVVGITWWPLFDFVDWSWASGGAVVEEFYYRDEPGATPRSVQPPGQPGKAIEPFLRRMGLYELRPESDGSLSRVRTSALDRFVAHADEAALSAGAVLSGDGSEKESSD